MVSETGANWISAPDREATANDVPNFQLGGKCRLAL
jgi:hypothetical protein